MVQPTLTKNLAHYHFRFKAKIKNPPKSEEAGVSFMERLVAGVGMEMAQLSRGQANPIAWYSTPEHNQGMTLAAILTTSNASAHIWDKEREFQFDLYSCAEFDVATVLDLTDEFVGIERIEWLDFINRETGHDEVGMNLRLDVLRHKFNYMPRVKTA